MASTLTAYIPNTKITETTSPIGFIDTTSYLTRIRITEDASLTLSSGFIIGQLKKIQMIKTAIVKVGGQHFLDGSLQTIIFSQPGDTAELMWTRNGWRIISTSNLTGDATTPEII